MKHYIPAIISSLLAILFLLVPEIAVFLLSGALFTFAIFYTFMVYQFQKAKKHFDQSQQTDFSQDQTGFTEPNFRNVTIRMIKRGSFFEKD